MKAAPKIQFKNNIGLGGIVDFDESDPFANPQGYAQHALEEIAPTKLKEEALQKEKEVTQTNVTGLDITLSEHVQDMTTALPGEEKMRPIPLERMMRRHKTKYRALAGEDQEYGRLQTAAPQTAPQQQPD